MSNDFTGFLRNSIILVDTSSIMLVSTNKPDSKLFWSNLTSKAAASNSTIIVPSGVVKELDKNQSSERKSEEAISACKRALKKLLKLQKSQAVFVVDDHINTKRTDGSVFADPFFINFVNAYKTTRNLYIITQDVNLMTDIHRTVRLGSLSGKVKDAHGEERQLIPQKKVTVLKVVRRGVGNDAVVEAGSLRKFFPDWTLADIAQEIGHPVDECKTKLREITGKDIQATETISKPYERRLKEAFGVAPSRNEASTAAGSGATRPDAAPAPANDMKSGEHEQQSVESKLPEFKPIWGSGST